VPATTTVSFLWIEWFSIEPLAESLSLLGLGETINVVPHRIPHNRVPAGAGFQLLYPR